MALVHFFSLIWKCAVRKDNNPMWYKSFARQSCTDSRCKFATACCLASQVCLQLSLPEVGKVKVKCTLVQALMLCTGRTAHRGRRGIALLRLCTGRTAHRKSRGIAILRLYTGRTVHRGSRVIALLRLCTGRTAHRGSRVIALLRICTGCTAHRGSRGIALLFHDQRH